MDISDDQRQALAARVRRTRGLRFNTKVAAYQAAGLNAATWGRIEAGERVRDDRLRAAVRALWPETGGDWTLIDHDAPGQRPREVESWLAELDARVEALERYLRTQDEESEDREQRSAAIAEDPMTVRAPGAHVPESALPTEGAVPRPRGRRRKDQP